MHNRKRPKLTRGDDDRLMSIQAPQGDEARQGAAQRNQIVYNIVWGRLWTSARVSGVEWSGLSE